MIVVVVGMHRSGSSLVASLCQGLGIDMGNRLLGVGPGNADGHFEDLDFYELNMQILKAAGGNWINVPPHESILLAGRAAQQQVDALVDQRVGKAAWGWKDPRNCLTLEIYLKNFVDRGIEDVRIVRTQRDRREVIQSLLRRSGNACQRWGALYDEYLRRADLALERYKGFYSQQIVVHHAALINRFRVRDEVRELARFLGCTDKKQIEGSLSRVRCKV